jgi:hypothetical protein
LIVKNGCMVPTITAPDSPPASADPHSVKVKGDVISFSCNDFDDQV